MGNLPLHSRTVQITNACNLTVISLTYGSKLANLYLTLVPAQF